MGNGLVPIPVEPEKIKITSPDVPYDPLSVAYKELTGSLYQLAAVELTGPIMFNTSGKD